MPQVASACQFGVRLEIGEVHANGLLELTWHCNDRYCTDALAPSSPRIIDVVTMEEVPGAVVWSVGWGTSYASTFWKPAEPLVAGRTYRVSNVTSVAEIATRFTVLPAVTWAPTDELEVMADLDVSENFTEGDISCMARFRMRPCPPANDSGPEVVSLRTRFQTSLWISAYATHASRPLPPMKRRSVFWRKGDAAPDLASRAWDLHGESQRFTEGAESYCYRIGVESLLDGSGRVWEGCLPHGDRPALETREAGSERIVEEIVRCLEPPDGLEREWCEQSMDYCNSGPGVPRVRSDCDNVAMRCASAPAPDDSVDDEDAGVTNDDSRPSRKARASGAGDSGCSIHPEPNDASSPLLLLLATFAAALAWRRARRS